MTLLNSMIGSLVDLLLLPFRDFPPVVGLAIVSLATSLVMLLVIKRTSDQAALSRAKRAIIAALFEIRLFNDDLSAVFRAQVEMLRQNAIYVRLTLIPMLWMIVPLSIVIPHLEGHFGYAGLAPGEPVLVKATLADGQAPGAAELAAPEAIRISTPAVWFPAAREVVWQVTPQRQGDFVLKATINGATYPKTLDVTDRVVRRSPIRLAPGLVNEFMYPAEAPLPQDAPVRSLGIWYRSRAIGVFGWQVPWLVVYFVLTMMFAWLLKKPLGVAL